MQEIAHCPAVRSSHHASRSIRPSEPSLAGLWEPEPRGGGPLPSPGHSCLLLLSTHCAQTLHPSDSSLDAALWGLVSHKGRARHGDSWSPGRRRCVSGNRAGPQSRGRPACFSEDSWRVGPGRFPAWSWEGVCSPERTKDRSALVPLFPEALSTSQFITS